MRAPGLLLVALLLGACGSSPLQGSAPDAAPPAEGGLPDVPQHEAPAGCPPALATAAELASTPRADGNLELLALKLSPGKIVAPEATYQRVVRDVGAIRARVPELANITFTGYRDGRTISFVLPLDTAARMKAGTYHEWDCLNETFGAVVADEFIRIGNADEEFLFIKLRGLYATDLLAPEYARLPGITSTDSIAFGGGASSICATGGPSTWHYVFDQGSNDCPAGCIDHDYRHFTTEPDGTVAELDGWSTLDGTPRPPWVTQLASPETCH